VLVLAITEGTGLNDGPVPTLVPPVGTVYQVRVPPLRQVDGDVRDCDAVPWQILTPVPVGGWAFVNTTSSKDDGQGELVIVHLKVAVDPAGTVAVAVGEEAFTIVAEPLWTVHRPVPGAGALPARVKVKGAAPQFDWSGPAAAVTVGATLTLTVDVAVQPLVAVYVTV
jgi:hypothetical protein